MKKKRKLREYVNELDLNDLPEQSSENDIIMAQQVMSPRNGKTYGNTKLADHQFVYFYIKYGGNISAMQENELNWMCIQALYNRAGDLQLPCIGKSGKTTETERLKVKIFLGIIDKGQDYTKLAEELHIDKNKVKSICTSMGIERYKEMRMTDDVFIHIYRYCNGSPQKIHKATGRPLYAIDRKIRELKDKSLIS